METEKNEVTYSLKELFDNQNKAITDLRNHVDTKINWLLGLMIAGFFATIFGLGSLIFNMSNKMDKVIDKVHSNDKRITVLEK